jgi:hypothetical protein
MSSTGDFATLAVIRRASSFVSNLAADRRVANATTLLHHGRWRQCGQLSFFLGN